MRKGGKREKREKNIQGSSKRKGEWKGKTIWERIEEIEVGLAKNKLERSEEIGKERKMRQRENENIREEKKSLKSEEEGLREELEEAKRNNTVGSEGQRGVQKEKKKRK